MFAANGCAERVETLRGRSTAVVLPAPADLIVQTIVSLINLASITALEAVVGAPVDPLRFRANVYLEEVPASSELDWVGSEIALGGARLRIIAAITRCAATEVNPATAERDLDIVGALQRGFGHNQMCIYAEVLAGGEIAIGDGLALRRTPVPSAAPNHQ